MTNSLAGKIVIITGASSGIGKALAFEFASKNAVLVIAARNEAKLEAVAEELKMQGTTVTTVVADVSSEEDCRKLIDDTINRYGKLDILVNNAGLSMRAIFSKLKLDVVRRLMDVNFWGTVYCTYYALPHLLQSKGTVCGIISVAGHIGLPGRTGYSASKFAVRGFLESLRNENLRTGLHVLIVAPGFTTSNIRNVALAADGSSQGESPRDENKMMSAEKAAQHISKAIEQRRNNLILTFKEGKLTVFLHKWFPSLIGKLAFKHLAHEPNSPFN